MQDVEDLGKKYEVKEVKNGHARNFLIPKKLARAATAQAMKWLEGQKEVIAQEVEEDLKKAQELASQLDGMELSIGVKVGDEGQMFESINSQKIVEHLKKMGFEVKKSQVKLSDPIKEIGEYPVSINLDHNLEVEIKVIITSETDNEEKIEE